MASGRAPTVGIAGFGMLALLALAPAGTALAGRQPSAGQPQPASGSTAAAVDPAAARSGLRFEPNVGQAPASVRFLARSPGQTAWLDAAGATVVATPGRPAATARPAAITAPRPPASPVRLSFEGAAATARAVPTDRVPGVSNYLTGRDPAGWHTGVPAFSGLRFADVYPGIDVRYSAGRDASLRFDLLVAPGADPNRVRLRLPAASSVVRERSGDLLVRTGSAPPLRLHRPTAFQPGRTMAPPADPTRPVIWPGRGSGRTAVPAAFRVSGRTVTVALGSFDRSRPLVIDPTIVYSTPFPGSVDDLAVDRSGAIYVASSAVSAGAPVHRLGPTDGTDAVIAKVNRTGSALEWITYLGGSAYDAASALSADPDGGVLVTGYTSSPDFPLRRPTRSQPGRGFVAALDSTGAALSFATYLGNRSGYTVDVAAGPGARAIVLLAADAAGLPLVGPGARPFGGGYDGYLTALDTGAGRVAFGGYVGGSEPDFPSGLAVGTDGTSYLTGDTQSADFPVSSAVQPTLNGSSDGFLVAFDPRGRLATGTYLGGSEDDTATDVAVDGSGVVVAGGTSSADFPTRQAAQATSGGYDDTFLTRFAVGGRSILTSTYLGGPSFDQGDRVALGPDGTAYVAGQAGEGFPTVSPLPGQTGELFVAALTVDGQLRRATRIGVGGGSVAAIEADRLGQVSLGGYARTGSMPSVHPLPFGGRDSYLMRLQLLAPAAATCAGVAVTMTGTDRSDRLAGTTGADVIDARGGADVIDGGGGDDVICGGPGADRLAGGAGHDVLRGDADADVLDGGSGPDVLDGGDGGDQVRGGDGDDVLNGGAAADTVDGAGGSDVLNGGTGEDRLLGGAGDDTMSGGGDRDVCLGGAGRADTAVECEVARCQFCWQPALPAPVPGDALLFDVAAAGPRSAWAVGAYRDAGGVSRGLVQRNTGSGWRLVPVPAPANSQLVAVAVAGGQAWAVGASFTPQGAARPLVMRGEGTTWRVVAAPTSTGGLSGVSVLGDQVWVSGADGRPLIARWAATGWSRLPDPPGLDVASDVLVDRPGSVWTGGWRFVEQIEGVATDALHWTGTRWQRTPVGSPAATWVEQDVSDISLLPGLGIRFTGAAGDFRGGFRESFLQPPNAPGAGQTFPGFSAEELAGSARRAWLVGFTATGEYYEPDPQRPAAFGWDGRTFRPVPITSFGQESALFGVEVLPAGGTWAVGGYADRDGFHAVILEQPGR